MTYRSPVLAAITLGLCVMGLAFIGAGAWLAALGGSWYYLAAGLALLLAAAGTWTATPGVLGLYAAMLAATLVWSLWEIGLEWWSIAARGDVLFVVGLLLWTPWIARRLVARGAAADLPATASHRRHRLALGAVLACYAVVGGVAWAFDPTAQAVAQSAARAAPPLADGPPGWRYLIRGPREVPVKWISETEPRATIGPPPTARAGFFPIEAGNPAPHLSPPKWDSTSNPARVIVGLAP